MARVVRYVVFTEVHVYVYIVSGWMAERMEGWLDRRSAIKGYCIPTSL